jgi:RNA polymerase sigma-70 factor (ECF subfamily)
LELSALCQDNTVALCDSGASPREAFEVIVKRHMKDAYLIALGLVGNREDALELSQEAFYRAYKHYDQLNSKGKFFPWFYRILRNLCFSHLRKRRVRRAYAAQMEESGPQGSEGDCHPPPADIHDCFDPEMVAERNETKDRIWRAISRLDDKHREVIILRHFRNLSYEEMARLLFCNQGTITSRLFYARQRLKEILEHEMSSPDPGSGERGHQKGGQT